MGQEVTRWARRVERPSLRSRSCREALQEDRQESGGPPTGTGRVGMDGRGHEVLLEGRERL